jgi:Tol biopolymer transport system component
VPIAIVGLVLGVLTAPAQAAFPGANGKIAYQSDRDGNNEIYTIAGDLSPASITRLTNNSSLDSDPAWSPDGTKLAFVSNRDGGNVEIYRMNADGSGQTRLTTSPAYDADPAWSPDGNQIVFASDRDGDFELFKMNADGTGQTQLTFNSVHDGFPAWSPDGQKIAYQTVAPILHDYEIYTINTDGTGLTNLTQSSGDDTAPNWSPTGSWVDFMSDRNNAGTVYLWQMNRDGSSQTRVDDHADVQFPAWSPDGNKLAAAYPPLFPPSSDREITTRSSLPGNSSFSMSQQSGTDTTPDWQPLVSGYPRPRGATPISWSLTPAYNPCVDSNTKHRAPIGGNACAPPSATSPYLTVGTPDFNGKGANSVGLVRMSVVCIGGAPGEAPPCATTSGDQLDGRIAVSITDVRCAGTSGGCSGGPLSDYTGDLRYEGSTVVTDRNSYGQGGATVYHSSSLLLFTIPCAPTSDTTVGSTCSVTTSLDGIFGAGTIVEQKRAIWEIDDFIIEDGGSDGVASTCCNNTFATPGLFFP